MNNSNNNNNNSNLKESKRPLGRRTDKGACCESTKFKGRRDKGNVTGTEKAGAAETGYDWRERGSVRVGLRERM